MRIELGLKRNRVNHPAHLQPVYEWGGGREKAVSGAHKGFVAYAVLYSMDVSLKIKYTA